MPAILLQLKKRIIKQKLDINHFIWLTPRLFQDDWECAILLFFWVEIGLDQAYAKSGPRGPQSILMWPVTDNFIIIDSYFYVVSMVKSRQVIIYHKNNPEIRLNQY